jgi:hypothetical protein
MVASGNAERVKRFGLSLKVVLVAESDAGVSAGGAAELDAAAIAVYKATPGSRYVVALSLEAVLARGMMEEHACCISQYPALLPARAASSACCFADFQSL